jgi:putative nucleotidyltransferase with HDIG domain
VRDTVARIWAHAWRISAWRDPADSYSIAYLPRWNLVAHTRGVVHASRSAAEALSTYSRLSLDDELLVSIALLHDVAKLVEWDPGADVPVKSRVGRAVHHATMGAQWALEAGLPEAVAQAIFAHTPQVSATPATIEGRVVELIDQTLAQASYLASDIEARSTSSGTSDLA